MNLHASSRSSKARGAHHGGAPCTADRPQVTLPATTDGQPYVSRLATRAALYADLHALLAAAPRSQTRS
jgi:hypothetical protein